MHDPEEPETESEAVHTQEVAYDAAPELLE